MKKPKKPMYLVHTAASTLMYPNKGDAEAMFAILREAGIPTLLEACYLNEDIPQRTLYAALWMCADIAFSRVDVLEEWPSQRVKAALGEEEHGAD